jgi:AAA family ATP:ADP antiporter
MARDEPRRRSILARVVEVRPGEGPPLLLAFAWFFALLFGYYLLRPIREEMGIRADPGRLHWLFTATFAAMLVAVPLQGALFARVPRRLAVPWIYRFFLLNLLAFWALVRADVAPIWVARAFYVWVSVYNLFVVSVFWSVLADLFESGQGKRLFGFVAGGGSAGALLGSATVAWLAAHVGVANLVLLSAVLLEAAARFAGAVARRAPRREAPAGEAPAGDAAPRREEGALGGSAFAGFTAVARSPYLLAIAVQMLLFSLGSTFLYFNLARSVAAAFPDPAARAALFAKLDLGVSLAALATQSLASGRIVAALGLGGALAAVPALTAVGFAIAAAAPGVLAFGGFQAVRRAAHFAVERPSREVLFTVVPREEKYKAKAFVDTFVYRGGDALSGWLHAGLAGLGLALPALSLAAIPFALAAVGVAAWLARRERALERGGRARMTT